MTCFKIYVKDANGNHDTFTLQTGAGTTKGTFRQDGTTTFTGEVQAYYPKTLVQEDANLAWPAAQTNDQTIPMYCKHTLTKTGDQRMDFSSLGSVLQIVFNTTQENVTLRSIGIKDGEKYIPAGALAGKFSVSATKQVYFSKGNLYADGSYALHFEDAQWKSTPASVGSKDASHVSHFTWSDNITSAVSNSNSGSNLFCDENHKVSVDESDLIYYALSKDEWTYLFNNHTKKWASVNGVNGYVIAPDGITGELEDSYTDDAALASAGNLVFLPAAGRRSGSNVRNVGVYGFSVRLITDVK